MFRVARLLIALLTLTLFAANSASAITAASVEKTASGLFGEPEQRVGIDALASSDRIDEKLMPLYDFASDFPVAERELAPLILRNKAVGDAFRDELAALLTKAGRQVQTEVYKWTPFGKRFIDIEVSQNGTVLGGIEAKTGASRYTSLQRLKDWYLTNMKDYPVNVARGP
jgi:hypothetical protein